jgi:hypothetical protein
VTEGHRKIEEALEEIRAETWQRALEKAARLAELLPLRDCQMNDGVNGDVADAIRSLIRPCPIRHDLRDGYCVVTCDCLCPVCAGRRQRRHEDSEDAFRLEFRGHASNPGAKPAE